MFHRRIAIWITYKFSLHFFPLFSGNFQLRLSGTSYILLFGISCLVSYTTAPQDEYVVPRINKSRNEEIIQTKLVRNMDKLHLLNVNMNSGQPFFSVDNKRKFKRQDNCIRLISELLAIKICISFHFMPMVNRLQFWWPINLLFYNLSFCCGSGSF